MREVNGANPVLPAARSLLAAGLSLLPVALDGSKRPDGRLLPRARLNPDTGKYEATWGPFKEALPTDADLESWFGGKRPCGIGVIGGRVSGNLEQLDFDADAERVFPEWCGMVEEERPGLVACLCVTQTPREPVGYHVRYRCPDVPIPGNTKLARDPEAPPGRQVLIETRGEGGYAVAPGSPAEVHETGRPYRHHSGPSLDQLPSITAAEREILIRCARYFDRAKAQDEPPQAARGGGLRPGDDYDRRGPDWEDILRPHGWECVCTKGPERRWKRPDKKVGWSATTGHCSSNGADLLRVFSGNAAPFEEDRSYGKFRAYALLNHRGDCKAAAQALAGEGYGEQRRPPPRADGYADQAVAGDQAGGAGGGDGPPAFELVLIPCSQLRKTPPERLWVVDGMFARKRVTLYSALWKAGKTTLLAHLLRDLERDGQFCGRACKAARVLYVTEEEQGEWADRRDELGLADHIAFVERPFLAKPTWPEWFGFLAALGRTQERERFDLIVLDTLTNLWPVQDENKAPEVQAALMPLHGAIGEAALALVHHLRKADGAEGTASRGSGALLSFVDNIIELRRYSAGDRHDTRRVLTGYGRRKESNAELVVRLTDDGYVAEGDRAEARQKDLAPHLDALVPANEPGATFKDLAAGLKERTEAGVRHEILRAALKQGVKEGRYVPHGKKPVRYTKAPADPESVPRPNLYRTGRGTHCVPDEAEDDANSGQIEDYAGGVGPFPDEGD
jgi:AAA domain/Bifunctional DNA primase/polymerase, N-terminal